MQVVLAVARRGRATSSSRGNELFSSDECVADAATQAPSSAQPAVAVVPVWVASPSDCNYDGRVDGAVGDEGHCSRERGCIHDSVGMDLWSEGGFLDMGCGREAGHGVGIVFTDDAGMGECDDSDPTPCGGERSGGVRNRRMSWLVPFMVQ